MADRRSVTADGGKPARESVARQPAGREPAREAAAREIPQEVFRFAGLPHDRQRLLLSVDELLEQIRYGNVIIVVQDGTVIQIETSEKIRLR